MVVPYAISETFALARRSGGQLLGELFPSIGQVRRGEGNWEIDEPSGYCGRCGTSVGPGSVTGSGCTFCLGKRLPWDRFVRLGSYRTPMDRWITAMKFGGDWSRAAWFGRRLAPLIRNAALSKQTVVCPVPMHWLRRCHRGYNQAELIGRAIAEVNRLPFAEVLRRVRYTAPQTAFAATKRRSNVRGSLSVRRVDLTGWHVWLVDDVKTTGATLSACARVLKRAGVRRLSVAVAAVADDQNGKYLVR